MSSGPKVFQFGFKGRFRLAVYPLALALLLHGLNFLFVPTSSWKFWTLFTVASLLLLRAGIYLASARAVVVISDEGVERDGRTASFDGAQVTLRTRKEGSVDVVLDVLVEGAKLPNGSAPSVVFDQSLKQFADAVQAVLVHVPDSNIQVIADGEPQLTEEQKNAVLAPFKGNAVERALAQLGRPGALNIPPHLRN